MKRKNEVAVVNPNDWTPEKDELLQEQEGIIEECKSAFGKVFNALTIIKTEGLYLKTHADFKTYCQERFGFSREWIWKLGKIIEVDAILESVNQLTDPKTQAGVEKLVTSSANTKFELVGLSPKKVAQVAKKIDKKATISEVKKVVAQVQHKSIPTEDDEEIPVPVSKCPKCGKKTSGPTKDWVQNLVCICDNKAEPKPVKIPALESIKTQTSLNLHPVLIALDNEWVNIQRGLAYGDWKPVQIYQKLRTAVEKAIVVA